MPYDVTCACKTASLPYTLANADGTLRRDRLVVPVIPTLVFKSNLSPNAFPAFDPAHCVQQRQDLRRHRG